ncbi:hypothetical protein EVAR_56153_1 [Eumeta japonica]|uniref:Uncharacterized protein n=1 Tax=Eumeta variegata TaxID=151549 RepID=A0A4C1Y3L2_EUMVA|nr:hypothetical protein EVAR_56153_1 [Eumeta japonica]
MLIDLNKNGQEIQGLLDLNHELMLHSGLSPHESTPRRVRVRVSVANSFSITTLLLRHISRSNPRGRHALVVLLGLRVSDGDDCLLSVDFQARLPLEYVIKKIL